jgi:signal transduction histidine kinase
VNTNETGRNPEANQHLVVAYVADLELEVDRLRKLAQFMQHEVRQAVQEIERACDVSNESSSNAIVATAVRQVTGQLSRVLDDGYEPTGYHPAHDQVVAIAVRPLVEQIFRWQQRLLAAPNATLHLDLSTEHVDWFPARFRHILDNLISNALRYRDPTKGEARVSLSINRNSEGYELRVSDNGLGMPWSKRAEAFELYYRSGPGRAAGLGVGIAVVRLLLEQSGGGLRVESGAGQGTSFVALLPYFSATDFIS